MTQNAQDIDFELLFRAQKNETLLLIDGGMCHYHCRKDGQCTIRVLISTKSGAGSSMLKTVIERAEQKGMSFLLAVCPADLASNKWYKNKGFVLDHTKNSKTGRLLNVWTLSLSKKGFNLN
jgi:predicted acetyltransferase